MEKPKVSVIIPVYGVEKYIERCVRSLFEQTLDSLEYIFVNDCTPDRSMEILNEVLEEYPNRKPQVKIINMPVNSKQAAARTVGMKAATGLYQIHCNPDDWVELDAYRAMYEKAVETGADVVSCKFMAHKSDKFYISGMLYDGAGLDCLRLLRFHSSLWDKLIRSSVIIENEIYPYPNINSGEDMNVIFRVLYYSKYVTGIDCPYYNYNYENEGSITNKSKLELFEKYLVPNMGLLEKFVRKNYSSTLWKAFSYEKIRSKTPLLWPDKGDRKRYIGYWCRLFPETRKFFLTYPGLNKRQCWFFYLFYRIPFMIKLYFRYLDFRLAHSH